MTQAKYLERQIDEMSYPAKLPADQKRYLANKLLLLEREARQQKDELRAKLNGLSQYKTVEIDKLNRKQKSKIAQVVKLQDSVKSVNEQIKNLTAELVELGVAYFDVPGKTAKVKASDTEYAEQVRTLNAAVNAVDERAKQQQFELRQIAKNLAEAEAARIAAKIANVSPELARQVENIGKNLKALPGEVIDSVSISDEE